MTRSEDDEHELFRDAMRDVRRLESDAGADTGLPRPAPVPRQRQADDRAVMRELLRPTPGGESLGPESGEAVSYLRPGYQRRVLQRLRRGHYAVTAELDLHGMGVAQARTALRSFLTEARERDCRCVRIVHGKGRRSGNDGPVLKGKVDRWLRQREEIIAFCSARRVDGGTGAMYVLMR